jgi:EpsD family peptidyl-prolyl cis-trans isomerase
LRPGIALAVALALIASSCNKKAEGQTVVIVNGEEITAAELNAQLANANLPADVDKADALSRILQRMIDRRLFEQQARKEGLDKSPEFLNRQRRMTEDLLINMLAARQIDTAQLPSAQEIQSFEASRPEMFANREQWSLEQLLFKMPTDGAARKRIADAKSLDQLTQVLTDSRITFTRSKNRLDTAAIPHHIYSRITAMSAGEPFIIPVGDGAIASSVVSRVPAPLAGEEAKPIAVAAIRRNQGSKLVENRLKALRQSAKIEYKEGYAPTKK